MTKKYVKKIVTIEAIQITPTNHKEVVAWINSYDYQKIVKAKSSESQGTIKIETPRGIVTAYEGDWLIRDNTGTIHPMDASIFEMTYEEAK